MTISAATDAIRAIDEIVQERHLLKHPFYQAWNEGRLTLDALREYAKQYWHYTLAFPQSVSAVHAQCPDMADRQTLLENLIEEERGADNHPELWLRFGEALGLRREEIIGSEPLPETAALVDTYRELTARDFVSGATALYSYESQVPAIAETKIAGLRQFYGMEDDRALAFFTVHLGADVAHAQAGREMIARNTADYDDATRCQAAAERATTALWQMLDGVHERYVAN